MNKAVVEYALQRCRRPRALLDSLNVISASLREKEGNSWRMNPSAAVLLFNQARLCFQLKKYKTAMDILEGIFENGLEHVRRGVVLRTCFLLLEIYLHSTRGLSSPCFQESKTVQKAKRVLQFLEKSVDEGDDKSKESRSEFLFRLHLTKARMSLRAESTKQVKREIKAALDSLGHDSKKSSKDGRGKKRRQIPPDWWRSSSGHTEDAISTVLKANMELGRSNHQKSVKLLDHSREKGIDDTIFFNGMGCAHFQMEKYEIASVFFARAISTNAKQLETHRKIGVKKDCPPNERRIHVNNLPDLYYNSGLTLLKSSRPALAFKCFRRAALHLYMEPKVWIRIAECCVAAWTAQNSSSDTLQHLRVVGSGASRRIVLPITPSPNSLDDLDGARSDRPTLAYAKTSLRNALTLLGTTSEETKRHGKSNSKRSSSGSGVESRDEQSRDRKMALLASALLTLSFVCLRVSSFTEALHYAKRLLRIRDISDHQRCLASFYAAEALCTLDRGSDALKMLSPSLINQRRVSADLKASYHVHVAKINALQGDFGKAEKHTTQALSINEHLDEAKRLRTYIHLRRGDTGSALTFLRSR